MNQSPIANAVSRVMPLARATELFDSLATISAPDGLLTAGGSPSGTYADVAGLINIPCVDAPVAVDRYNIMSNEMRGVSQSTVDGNVYDIAAAESDSQRTQTRLSLREVTV